MSEHPPAHDPDDLPSGTILCGGRYVIESRLRRGELSTAYRVYTSDGHWTVLELMAARHGDDEQQQARFEQQWEALRSLRGRPYALAVEAGIGHHEGRPFFTRELLEAPTLAELVLAGEVTVQRACQVLRDVADALDDLHGRGMAHGALEPAHVVVTPDGVRLIDFDVVSECDDEDPTNATAVASATADVDALAFTLHEALAGLDRDGALPPGLPTALVQLMDEGAPSAAAFRGRLDAVLQALEIAEPSELLALRQADACAEAAARRASRGIEKLAIPAPLWEAAAQGHRIVVAPAYVHARLMQLEADRAAKTLAEALHAYYGPHARDRQSEPGGAEAPPVDGQLDAAPRRSATSSRASSRAWAATALGLGAVLGLAWWGYGGEPQPKTVAAAAAAEQDAPEPEAAPPPEPTPQPEAAAAVEPEAVEVTPATKPEPRAVPALELDADAESEPVPAPEPEAEPSPQRKAEKRRKAGRRRSTEPRGKTAPSCENVEADAKEATRARQWRRVLQLTSAARCWDDPAVRGRLRVKALLESGRLSECAAFDSPDARPEVRRMATHCARRLEEEGAS